MSFVVKLRNFIVYYQTVVYSYDDSYSLSVTPNAIGNSNIENDDKLNMRTIIRIWNKCGHFVRLAKA